MVSPFSIEVIEHIIDCAAIQGMAQLGLELSIDHGSSHTEVEKTLIRFSLTSRLWLPRSRYHLARLLMQSMTSRAQLQGLVRLLEHLEGHPAAQHKPHLSTSMTLRGDYKSREQWIHRIPLVLGKQRLLHVHTLRILDVNVGNAGFPPAALCVGFPMFVSVTSLTLDKCIFATFHQLRRLICAFPALRDLCLEGVAVIKLPLVDTASFPARPTGKSQLSTVRFSGSTLVGIPVEQFNSLAAVLAAVLNSWLCSTQPALPVDWALDFPWSPPRMDLVTVMHNIGRSLKSLGIVWRSDGPSCYCDLSENINLEKLTISAQLKSSAEVNSIVGEQIPKSLKSLPENSHLRHLSVRLMDWFEPQFRWSRNDLRQWQRVVEALAEHTPLLKHVNLLWESSPTEDAPAELVPDQALAGLEAVSAPLLERGVSVELEWVVSDWRTKFKSETTRRLLSPPAKRSQQTIVELETSVSKPLASPNAISPII